MTVRTATEFDASAALHRAVVDASRGRLTFELNRWALGGDGGSHDGRP